MRFKVELAEYKRAVYSDTDKGLIVTIKFPLMKLLMTSDQQIKQFDFIKFIEKIQH